MTKKFMIAGKEFLIEDIIALGMALIGILAVFMPYITLDIGITSNTQNLMSNKDGIFYIAAYILALLLIYFGKTMFVGISGILSLLFMLISYLGMEDIQKSIAHYNIGFFLTLIIAIALIVCSYLSYRRTKDGDEKLDESFSNIAKKTKEATDTLKTKLSEVNTTVNSKSNVKCPKCGNEYSRNVNFCPECGEPKPKEPEKTRCENCNTVLPDGVKFCPKCGNPVQTKVCPSCGKKMTANEKFCQECGTKYEE